jgi:hypothetical protein
MSKGVSRNRSPSGNRSHSTRSRLAMIDLYRGFLWPMPKAESAENRRGRISASVLAKVPQLHFPHRPVILCAALRCSVISAF